MKINILCDNPRSWFWEKSTNFIKELESSNLVKVCKNENELYPAFFIFNDEKFVLKIEKEN